MTSLPGRFDGDYGDFRFAFGLFVSDASDVLGAIVDQVAAADDGVDGGFGVKPVGVD